MATPPEFETIRRHEFAVRRYKQIVPRPLTKGAPFPTRQIDVWLADDVASLVEEFSRRPRFQELAAWSLRNLTAGAGTPERKAVEAVDAGLLEAASLMSALASDPEIRRRLAEQNAPKALVTEEEVSIPANAFRQVRRRRRPAVRHENVDLLSIEIAQVADLARRPWDDLVRAADYFDPQQEWTDVGDGNRVQHGELIVSANPELHPIGDFISRCLRRRVDGYFDILDSLHRKCLAALRGREGSDRPTLTNLQDAWRRLEQRLADFRRLCFTGPECLLRDSCVILTQVYAGFHPQPDVGWLGLPEDVVGGSVIAIRPRLRQFLNVEMAERIAAALGDLGRLYEGSDPNQSARDEAIAAGGLSIDVAGRMVFWERQQVGDRWNGRPWDLLLKLAEKARLRASVEERDLNLPHAMADSFMATTCGRLKAQLPGSLSMRVISGSTARSYRLDLDPSKIHILQSANRPPSNTRRTRAGR